MNRFFSCIIYHGALIDISRFLRIPHIGVAHDDILRGGFLPLLERNNNNRSRRRFEHLPQWEIWPHEWDF